MSAKKSGTFKQSLEKVNENFEDGIFKSIFVYIIVTIFALLPMIILTASNYFSVESEKSFIYMFFHNSEISIYLYSI